MYLARPSQSELYNFHIPEILANAHTNIVELSKTTIKFVTEGAFDTDVISHCDVYRQSEDDQTPEQNHEFGQQDEQQRAQLVLLGEALNLEKLEKIQTALADKLQFKLWKIRPRAIGIGVVAKASVELKAHAANSEDHVSDAIDALCQQYRLEITLVSNPPVLSKGGLMVMDMDSTLIAVECIDEIAKLAGMGDKVASVTERAMQGKLDFAESLYSRVECLTGVEESLLEGIRDRLPLMPGVTKLISYMQRNGWKVVIASGGFTYFADYLKERLDMYKAVSNTLEVKDGKLTGKVLGGVVDADVKAETLESLASQLDVPKSQTIAVGDGANDLVMMSKAAMGVAYHAKPIVRENATAAIRFGGLDTMLDFLG